MKYKTIKFTYIRLIGILESIFLGEKVQPGRQVTNNGRDPGLVLLFGLALSSLLLCLIPT